ncbi:hypothetical protein N5C46_16310 [Rossellomorea vietnamensis]|uniref:Uncharacterized protein n=1 Tax=Rossellomorea vietnamensis TaxID=218284 RepID=A0ACD4C3Z1_9BACI|nr:hypothetical protein [Rossellomorea vietnamensis]UXH43243.1 hypothetical protein N5C46_16310 [Rossellomorea vietnamensis]
MSNSRKNIFLTYLLILSMTVFSACSASSPSEKAEKKEPENTSVEKETPSEEDAALNEGTVEAPADQEESSEEAEEENTDSEEPAAEEDQDSSSEKEEVNLLLQQLKPEKNMIKTFENKDFSLTETIVDHNDTHVQRVFKVGEMVTLQILKWDQDAIQVVYEESSPKDPKESKLSNFKPNKEMQPMADISRKGKGDTPQWEIISENETLEVPYDTFEHVVIVRNTVKAGNKETINTIYYAPGIGMIKEVYEDTGKNGKKIESVLKKVEEL